MKNYAQYVNNSSNSVHQVYILLLLISLFLVISVALIKLDFLLGVLIGCSTVVLNFHWTKFFLSKLISIQKVQPLNLFVYLYKLAISAIIIYISLIHFDIPPLALLIGLSNFVITVLIYLIVTSVKNSFY